MNSYKLQQVKLQLSKITAAIFMVHLAPVATRSPQSYMSSKFPKESNFICKFFSFCRTSSSDLSFSSYIVIITIAIMMMMDTGNGESKLLYKG